MSGVQWELLAFIYNKGYGLITRDIVPWCLAYPGKRVVVLDNILDSIIMIFSVQADRGLLVLSF
jgi:hypothetical protein